MRTKFQLSDVNWKDDAVTRNWVRENANELLSPRKMTVSRLATTVTFCETTENPYAEEFVRRAGLLQTFQFAADPTERVRILRKAAKGFGVEFY